MYLPDCKKIKESITVLDFLSRLGYQPASRNAMEKKEIFFHSMIRDGDRTPSFSINTDKELWIDRGTGEGGDIIDLAKRIFQTDSIKEVVDKINDLYGNIAIENIYRPMIDKKPLPSVYVMSEVKELGNNFALTSWLQQRGIWNTAVKSGILKEVYYSRTKEGITYDYFGIGWKNSSGGWEIRNPYAKTCIAPKDCLYLTRRSNTVSVFEGMFDYLAAMDEVSSLNQTDIVILNSLSMYKRAVEHIHQNAYEYVDLYLDNDLRGKAATENFKKEFPNASDRSFLYELHKDYNEKISEQIDRSIGR